MKNIILRSLFYFNIFFIFLSFTLFFTAAATGDRDWWMGETVMLIRTFGALIVFIFVVWLMVIWSQKDKKASRFLLLFFLMGFYSVFYFRIVQKNNWI